MKKTGGEEPSRGPNGIYKKLEGQRKAQRLRPNPRGTCATTATALAFGDTQVPEVMHHSRHLADLEVGPLVSTTLPEDAVLAVNRDQSGPDLRRQRLAFQLWEPGTVGSNRGVRIESEQRRIYATLL